MMDWKLLQETDYAGGSDARRHPWSFTALTATCQRLDCFRFVVIYFGFCPEQLELYY